MVSNSACRNCGAELHGKYCSNCGQKVYEEHDKKFSHFLHEATHFFSHLDNKFLKTLWGVFRHPGSLSLNYSEGIRKRYFSPFSLFFIGVILYLLFPLFQGLNLSLEVYRLNFSNGFVSDMIAYKMKSLNISFAELAERYNHKSSAVAKPMLLVVLPLSGLALRLLFAGRKKYYFDHLLIGTEINIFYLYFTYFIMPLLLLLVTVIIQLSGGSNPGLLADRVTFPTFLIVQFVWMLVAFRRFYKTTWVRSSVMSMLFLLLLTIIIYIIYRLILFFIVMLFV